MNRLVRTGRARRDIAEALAYSRRRWGDQQAVAYRALMAAAFETIAADPRRGRPRLASHPDVLLFRIARPGQPARHVIVYRVRPPNVIEVLRVLHDAMDLKQHLG